MGCDRESTPLLKEIISTAPVRINDIGGWTDTWFSGEGQVQNLAVSPRVEARIRVLENRRGREDRVRVRADNYGETFRIHPEHPAYDRHPLLQGAVNSLPIPADVELEIALGSEVPGGSSTGSSASTCVALLGGLDLLTEGRHTPEEIVSLAHEVETVKLGLQSGIQDQICAAHGGICFIRMHAYPHARVEKLDVEDRIRDALNRRLALIYLGASHSSSALHEEVIAYLESKGSRFETIRMLRDLAGEARACLLAGDLEALGEVMARNNECQRALHRGLISEEADAVIRIAGDHGAAGWKVNGAGGKGGSLTILGSSDDAQREEMLRRIGALKQGIAPIPITLSATGLEASMKTVVE